MVPFNQSELLYEALKKAGMEVTLVKIKGAGHGFGGQDVIALVHAFDVGKARRRGRKSQEDGDRS